LSAMPTPALETPEPVSSFSTEKQQVEAPAQKDIPPHTVSVSSPTPTSDNTETAPAKVLSASNPSLPEDVTSSPVSGEIRTPMVDNGALWLQLVETLNTPQTIGIYNFIRNPALTSGVLEGNVLTIYSIDQFGLDYIRQPDHKEVLRKTASRICGIELGIQFVEGPAPTAGTEDSSARIQELMKFGNVRFE
jgi:hypothetical protein